jgi:cyclohexanone monooxygenase
MMSIAQSGFTVNFPHMIGEQAKHIAYVISCALARGLRRLEVSAEAEAEWVDAVLRHSGMTQEFSQNCTPGYYNNEGQPSVASSQNGFYFGGPMEFVKLLEDWRADGTLKGLALR